MAFLNSLFLWGIAAAAIPLIIHLIRRSRPVKLPFAAMRFLQMEPDKRVRNQRLKQILLLLMRMTALALLALAFARPVLEDSKAVIWGEQPEAAVVLIDHSLSMAYEDNLQRALQEARKLLGGFQAGDQVAVMRFAETAQMVEQAERGFPALAARLERMVPLSHRSTHYLAALQAAEAWLLDSPLQRKTIYLISDLQKSALSNLATRWELQPGIELRVLPVHPNHPSNVAVADVLVSEKSRGVRRKDVLVRVRNYGKEKERVTVSLHLNDKRVSRKRTTLLPDEEKLVPFKNVVFPLGLAAGTVALEADETLTADNRFYFVSESRAQPEILAVSGEPNARDVTQDELFFLERAINVPRLAKYKLVKTNPQSLGQYDFNNYRAVILANVKDLSRSVVERLVYYVRGGGGLLLTLGDRTNPTIFNRIFRELTPATLTGQAFHTADRRNSVIIAEVDYQHPVFRVFADPGNGDPSVAQFYQYYRSEPVQPHAVIASFDDGAPALLERQLGTGKVLLLTSSIDSEWNNLPVRSLFVPLVYEMLDYIAAKSKGQKSYVVGQPVTIEDFARGPASTGFQILTPSGKVTNLDSEYYDATDEPGIYVVKKRNQSRKLGMFAVNVDRLESDLAPLSPEELLARFQPEAQPEIQAASVSPAQAHAQLESRQKLWRLFILLVVLLLVSETWLANRTYR